MIYLCVLCRTVFSAAVCYFYKCWFLNVSRPKDVRKIAKFGWKVIIGQIIAGEFQR